MTGTETATRFLTGVQDGWHAVDTRATRMGCEYHEWAVCGAVVRSVKDEHQPYDATGYPVRYNPCPACMWIVAAKTGGLDAAVASLTHDLAREAAENVIGAARADDKDMDDPAMIQVLTAITAHHPVELVDEFCAEGECDCKDMGHDNCASKPACRACSLQAGDWAGEWAGRYMEECTIPAPCAVLLRLAQHAKEAAGA